jgi:hypothetical protein
MANMISSFFDPGEAWDRAGKAEQEGYDKSRGYQEPFWQHGQDQYGRLNDAAGKLFDPAALQDEWSKHYETSPYAQQLLKQNQASGMDAASSMGLSGSSAALGNIQQGAGNIVSRDRQQYMDDLMKKYMAGIGLGTSLYDTGAQAGQNLGQQSMTHGENQANLQYGRYAAPGKLFENLMKTGVGVAAGALGAPAYLGTMGQIAGGLSGANNVFNPGSGG